MNQIRFESKTLIQNVNQSFVPSCLTLSDSLKMVRIVDMLEIFSCILLATTMRHLELIIIVLDALSVLTLEIQYQICFL